VCGTLKKPRKAWLLEGGANSLGLPVYALSGEVVGVIATIPSGIEEEEDGGGGAPGMGFLMRMMGGGSDLLPPVFVVPGRTVAPLVEQALKKAAELIEERQKEPAKETPAPPEESDKKPEDEK